MSFTRIPMVSQPHQINVSLYPHQLASIYKMEKLETDNNIIKEGYTKSTKIGINADMSGFGKTLSMLGLIARDKMEWDIELPYVFETIISEAKSRIKNYFVSRYDKLPTTLILVSNSIIGQWEKELEKTTLKYTVIKNCKNLEVVRAEENDVVVVTPLHYNKLVTMYYKFAWKRFIYDEPGHLKVSGMREVHAGFYWFVTATPEEILGQHKFCKGNFMRDILVNIYDPDCFITDLIIKNNPEFIKASFEMPETKYIYHKCYQPLYNVIERFVSQSVRTMIEAGNIEGAIDALGGTKTSNIVELIKSKKMEEIFEIDSKINIYTLREDPIKINQWLQKKERIEEQIKEIENKYNEMIHSECNICAEALSSPVLETNCQNLFCGKCLFKWLERKNTCPLCRSVIDLKNLIYISSSSEESKNVEEKEKEIKKMTKIEKIIDIIKSKPEGKFLVFSDYDNTFYPICDALRDNEIEFVQVKGAIKTREKNLDSFRDGNVPVIFLNSTTDGSGINLTESTDIILCHQMDKSTEKQIIGRALRIGRKEPLSVHYIQIMK
jgi:SNF2 family DNA or RNA helicase